MKIFCVIPAYNENKHIISTVEGARPLVDETVVVDDGSSDNTAVLARRAGATVLRHIVNRGQGAALRTGTDYALKSGAGVIVHFDADGQFLSGEIDAIVEPIRQGEADAVFGSRFLTKGSNMPKFKRAVIMPLARLVNRIFLNVRLTDPQCGFRALSRSGAEKIRWYQDGMAHCSEILYAAGRSGLRLKEVPVTVIYHRYGQRFWGGVKILKDLFLARLINS